MYECGREHCWGFESSKPMQYVRYNSDTCSTSYLVPCSLFSGFHEPWLVRA
jgi:hypothetical protein